MNLEQQLRDLCRDMKSCADGLMALGHEAEKHGMELAGAAAILKTWIDGDATESLTS